MFLDKQCLDKQFLMSQFRAVIVNKSTNLDKEIHLGLFDFSSILLNFDGNLKWKQQLVLFKDSCKNPYTCRPTSIYRYTLDCRKSCDLLTNIAPYLPSKIINGKNSESYLFLTIHIAWIDVELWLWNLNLLVEVSLSSEMITMSDLYIRSCRH